MVWSNINHGSTCHCPYPFTFPPFRVLPSLRPSGAHADSFASNGPYTPAASRPRPPSPSQPLDHPDTGYGQRQQGVGGRRESPPPVGAGVDAPPDRVVPAGCGWRHGRPGGWEERLCVVQDDLPEPHAEQPLAPNPPVLNLQVGVGVFQLTRTHARSPRRQLRTSSGFRLGT